MKLRIYNLLMLLCAAMFVMSSCNDGETYAEQKAKERNAIGAFLKSSPWTLYDNEDGVLLKDELPVKVITEKEFIAQDSTTDVSQNEYVLFQHSGIYMQIVREGVGERLQPGDKKQLICRYWEYNILTGMLQTTNNVLYWATNPEILDVYNNSGTITASFNTSINGGGAMYQAYKTTSVPTGWIVPLSYVRIGRQTSSDAGIAKVRLIVPHGQGQTDATSNVYPCFYEITYQEMRY